MVQTISYLIDLRGAQSVEERERDGTFRDCFSYRKVTAPISKLLDVIWLQMDRRKVVAAADARCAQPAQHLISIYLAVLIGQPHDEHEPAQAALRDGRQENNVFDQAQSLLVESSHGGPPRQHVLEARQ